MVDCNVFEQCRWLRHLGKVMILLVLVFVGLSLYAVVGDVYVPGVAGTTSGLQKIGFLMATVIFCVLVGMLVWSYFVAVMTDPGRVPNGWMPFRDEEEAEEELERSGYQRGGIERLAGSARPRFCRRCNAWKPPRAHHDSVTGHCVLKMDHYCVWILNCVGLLNYKAFLLFLFYACLASVMGAASLLGAFLQFLFGGIAEQTPVLVFVAFVVDAAFSLALIGFIIMHLRLVLANCTTIEMYEKRRVPLWPYDRGYKKNFMEVFGYRMSCWPIPVISKQERDDLLEWTLSHRQNLLEESELKSGAIEL